MSSVLENLSEKILRELTATRILARYSDHLDGDRLGEWIDMFTDDANYVLVTRENYLAGLPLPIMRCEGRPAMQDRIKAASELMMFAPRVMRHFVTNVQVQPDAEELKFSANVLVARSMLDVRSELFLVGTYYGRLVPRAGSETGYLIGDLTCVIDTSLIDNSIVVPL
ncbi:nuclear transport factor 2 family protein [Paraburkholderia sp. LEh10]|uniref:aromatic-ring-hydroxylating dioxygenase subunit beta n=1 Tax=Paraburkholderia sp. LEh10 TaxID=2821353 RepID=UPI001AE6C919|nr:nuclear transport factor 2 family protein [Paraburkholderia sp. LEh10]MBP0590408.1 nuclear transport factor 2 family protein [Paraburkholderia sp. LEh10]